MGETGTSPVRERRSGPGSPQGSGGEPLAGGAGRLRQEAQEGGASVWPGRKLGHVADAIGKGDGGGPASEQGLKPLRRLPARASSLSKARKTRGQPRRAAATRSTPWVPRAAAAGRPHPVRASQSKSPSATTVQDGAGPRRPIPSTGLGPGRAWNRGVRSGATARPTSQRTRPPEASGTTTMPANRSAPRSMNSPQSLSRSAEKPSDSRDSRSPLPGA